jgi:hypothetical protein
MSLEYCEFSNNSTFPRILIISFTYFNFKSSRVGSKTEFAMVQWGLGLKLSNIISRLENREVIDCGGEMS